MADNQGQWLFKQIQQQLSRDWEELREIYANSKGDAYEQTLSDFLTSYFGGVYDINTKVAVIDKNLISFDVFDFVKGDDEIDLVASFSQAKPRIIFKTGDGNGELRWVPFEAVAFICEVKSQLTKQALEKDFDKLKSVSQISESIDNRFGPMIGGDYTISEPLQCLVYDRESIADDTLEDILISNHSHWHMILLVDNDVLLLNRSIPLSEHFVPSSRMFGPDNMPELPPEILEEIESELDIDVDSDIITLDNGLFWFLITISATIPDPLSVNTVNSLNALSSQIRFYSGAKTEMDSEE
ncbi:DUF6602 domain-containing protein [Natronomonas sp. EA1]|uniref:DUF6602 domain-containing protein n=1 Tax=Natronomonas sp. EA1 TaxID=3421655 RepID=UPI003EBA4AC0